MADESKQVHAKEAKVDESAIEGLQINDPEPTTPASRPKPHCQFSVESHNLCYGSLHNIWHGANSLPLMTFPTVVRPRIDGTVKMHELKHNVPAKNGIWSVFQLVDVKSEKKDVCAWFACHEDVDARKEIDKILRISGSPYEFDSGSSLNNDETAEAGVLVINRYDWGYHDHRGDDVFPDSNETFLTAGIVDRAHAVAEINRWKNHGATERTASEWGVWMYIPQSEYLFGRFGFDDDRMSAQSFLFFTGSTCFTQSAFAGLEETLRKEETHEERFERRLREGYDFSGINLLKELTRPPPFPVSQAYKYEPPPHDQRLGPYDKTEHIYSATDIDALRLYTRVIGIAAPEMERVVDLLNELAMSYLDRFILPHCYCNTLEEAAAAIFPNNSGSAHPKTVIDYLHRYFTNLLRDPPVECGYESQAVDGRIRAFLTARFRTNSADENDSGTSSCMALDDDCITGLNRALVFIITELMELSGNVARDSFRDRIVPSDIRLSTFNDRELLDLLQYSQVLWEGRK